MASSAEKKKKKGKDKESQNTQTIAVMFAKATSPDKPAIHKLQYKLEGLSEAHQEVQQIMIEEGDGKKDGAKLLSDDDAPKHQKRKLAEERAKREPGMLSHIEELIPLEPKKVLGQLLFERIRVILTTDFTAAESCLAAYRVLRLQHRHHPPSVAKAQLGGGLLSLELNDRAWTPLDSFRRGELSPKTEVDTVLVKYRELRDGNRDVQRFQTLVERVSDPPGGAAHLGSTLLFLHYAQILADDARERLKVVLCDGIRRASGVKVAGLSNLLAEALVVRLFCNCSHGTDKTVFAPLVRHLMEIIGDAALAAAEERERAQAELDAATEGEEGAEGSDGAEGAEGEAAAAEGGGGSGGESEEAEEKKGKGKKRLRTPNPSPLPAKRTRKPVKHADSVRLTPQRRQGARAAAAQAPGDLRRRLAAHLGVEEDEEEEEEGGAAGGAGAKGKAARSVDGLVREEDLALCGPSRVAAAAQAILSAARKSGSHSPLLGNVLGKLTDLQAPGGPGGAAAEGASGARGQRASLSSSSDFPHCKLLKEPLLSEMETAWRGFDLHQRRFFLQSMPSAAFKLAFLTYVTSRDTRHQPIDGFGFEYGKEHVQIAPLKVLEFVGGGDAILAVRAVTSRASCGAERADTVALTLAHVVQANRALMAAGAGRNPFGISPPGREELARAAEGAFKALEQLASGGGAAAVAAAPAAAADDGDDAAAPQEEEEEKGSDAEQQEGEEPRAKKKGKKGKGKEKGAASAKKTPGTAGKRGAENFKLSDEGERDIRIARVALGWGQ